MEDIVIPMTRGNMEDIEQDGTVAENSANASEMGADPNSTAPNSSFVNYERESR